MVCEWVWVATTKINMWQCWGQMEDEYLVSSYPISVDACVMQININYCWTTKQKDILPEQTSDLAIDFYPVMRSSLKRRVTFEKGRKEIETAIEIHGAGESKRMKINQPSNFVRHFYLHPLKANKCMSKYLNGSSDHPSILNFKYVYVCVWECGINFHSSIFTFS